MATIAGNRKVSFSASNHDSTENLTGNKNCFEGGYKIHHDVYEANVIYLCPMLATMVICLVSPWQQ